MDVLLPLEQMTTADKLRALELIWEDLRRTPASIPAPAWHADVLHARQQRVQEGTSCFGDWTEAKKRIRESAK